ncbi:MAG TPA: MmcQ/YjbR family DNA-binding protein [Hyphomonadaceae bacterium]|jgi:predicted DNA-binding protein (MmcQ/YjbR family)|nr:MmcQ/YjbR family DNA-binding protein [Hyphomonadaceae bacterium]
MAKAQVKKAAAKKAPVRKPPKKPAVKAGSAKGSPLRRAEKDLIAYALTFPEAVLEHPWGHDAVKVKGKMFATFGGEIGDPKEMSMTVKLPVSGEMALTLPWVESTGYGLGKSGWVTARVLAAKDIDLETMKGWIGQSYRAVAPKGLVKGLG